MFVVVSDEYEGNRKIIQGTDKAVSKQKEYRIKLDK